MAHTDGIPLAPRDLLILSVLAPGKRHGYGIIKAVEDRSEARVSRSRRPYFRCGEARVILASVLFLAGWLLPEAGFASTPRGPQEVVSATIQSLDSLAAAAVESGQTVGLALGVYRGGEPIVSKGYGLADVENGVPVTDSTVFRIGSVTKQFTAAAILGLEEEGKLSLDDDLTRFLPDYPTGGRTITIHQLLNHTSGIKSYTGLGQRWRKVQPLDLSNEELLALFQDEPFDFEPGEGWAYNNSGYYLLGMIIEEVTGLGYDEYLEESFFGPLGLRDTSYCWERPIIPRRARGYQGSGDEIRNADPLSMTQPGAAGALCSSVRDLARWERALRMGEVISADSYRRMVTPVGIPWYAPRWYGYGLEVGELEGKERVIHGGGIPGFNARLAHYPGEDLTIVTLSNLNGPAAGHVADAAARIVLGLPLPEGEPD